MWDDPYGYWGAKRKRRRGSGVTKLPKAKDNRYHLGRASAEVKILTGGWIKDAATSDDLFLRVDESAIRARVVFGEVQMKWIGVFSEQPIEKGAIVALTIEKPIRFYCRAEVDRVKPAEMSNRVISQMKYPYRIFLQPQFENEEERKAFNAFVRDIQKRFVERPFYQWRDGLKDEKAV